ncbi:10848_t:CDS:1, partial [Cetraspora pellucida]
MRAWFGAVNRSGQDRRSFGPSEDRVIRSSLRRTERTIGPN